MATMFCANWVWGPAATPKGAATVWTCDLTKEYVAINGDYRS